jgi:hypothetical protein
MLGRVRGKGQVGGHHAAWMRGAFNRPRLAVSGRGQARRQGRHNGRDTGQRRRNGGQQSGNSLRLETQESAGGDRQMRATPADRSALDADASKALL